MLEGGVLPIQNGISHLDIVRIEFCIDFIVQRLVIRHQLDHVRTIAVQHFSQIHGLSLEQHHIGHHGSIVLWA